MVWKCFLGAKRSPSFPPRPGVHGMWKEKKDSVEKPSDPWEEPGQTHPEREGSSEELRTSDPRRHRWSQQILMMPETVKGKHILPGRHWRFLSFFFFFWYIHLSNITWPSLKKNCRQNNEIEAFIIWLSFLSSWVIFLHPSFCMCKIIEITLSTLSSATLCGHWCGNQWWLLGAQNKGSLGKPNKYLQTSPGVETQNTSQDFKMAWSLFSWALQTSWTFFQLADTKSSDPFQLQLLDWSFSYDSLGPDKLPKLTFYGECWNAP